MDYILHVTKNASVEFPENLVHYAEVVDASPDETIGDIIERTIIQTYTSGQRFITCDSLTIRVGKVKKES